MRHKRLIRSTTIMLTEEMHKALDAVAAERKLTLSEYLREIIEKHLGKRKKES